MRNYQKSAFKLMLPLAFLAVIPLMSACNNTKSTDTSKRIKLEIRKIDQSVAKRQVFAQLVKNNHTSNLYASHKIRRLRDDLVGVFTTADGASVNYYGGRIKKRERTYVMMFLSFAKVPKFTSKIRTLHIKRSQSSSTMVQYRLSFTDIILCIGHMNGRPRFAGGSIDYVGQFDWRNDLKGRRDLICIGDTPLQGKSYKIPGMYFETLAQMKKFATVMTSAFPQIRIE